LSSLVSLRRREDAVEVNHSGLRRVANVLVNTENRDIAGIASEINQRLKMIELPEGMHVSLKGEYSRMNESFSNLVQGLALAGILVYLLQVTLFRSWVGPFIIMFTVPLGFIGVLLMLYFTRTTINVQSLMGVIFLVGIAVNNGVLLVDFANKQALGGMNLREAIRLAAATRFRPIVMTFLATVLALTPMAIGLGKGNEANVPLARAVVGGMLTSTCLTLFMVPILYTLLMRKPSQENDIEAELADAPTQLPANRSFTP
jgi:multidrug efflux pump subunit AcrB